MTQQIIGSREIKTGNVEWHCISPRSEDEALCGLSIDGDYYDAIAPVHSIKITCEQCYALWETAKKVSPSQFCEWLKK